MSFTVTDAFIQQFTGTVRFTAQQQKSRLRGTVYEDTIAGETGYLEQVAPTAMQKRMARHGDSPIMNTQHLRRRVSTYGYEWGDIVDEEDLGRVLIDPTSAYSQNAGNAARRSQDDEIIGAAFATAYAGHSGSTSITWPNGNGESNPAQPAGTQVAVNDWTYGNGSGNVGPTISKLISASVALDVAEGDDEEERYIIIGGKQKGNLLQTTEATSADYNTVRALYDGKIDTFMGFKFIHSERLQKDASSYTRVLAYRKSGMGFGITKDIWTMVGRRPDKGYAWYPYLAQTVGSTRLEEAKVVEIKCL